MSSIATVTSRTFFTDCIYQKLYVLHARKCVMKIFFKVF